MSERTDYIAPGPWGDKTESAVDRRGGKPRWQCPECAGWQGTHKLDCSQITVAYALEILKSKTILANCRLARIEVLKKEVARWQGKFRTVAHENNQLRRKLSNGKTANKQKESRRAMGSVSKRI